MELAPPHGRHGLGHSEKKTSVIDRARDELFSHIHRCDVLNATEDQQREWIDDTMEYMAERYPEINNAELKELKALGLRFCQPVIPHGRERKEPSEEDANAA